MALYTTDPQKRAELIASLRALADHLAANPALPVPSHGCDVVLHADPTDEGGRFQVAKIARLLGVKVTDNTASGGHLYAARSFGAVCYEICSIPESWSAQYEADMSYRRCVTPDVPVSRS